MICRWQCFKTHAYNRFKQTGWVKSNRYLPFPEKGLKNIKFHEGSLRIACSNTACKHAIIQQVPLRVQFVLWWRYLACAIRDQRKNRGHKNNGIIRL